MKLLPNAIIAREKLTQYLLVFKKRNDKSRWLAEAGYSTENWHILEHDLRTQILSLDAEPADTTPYGQTYAITGQLTGPNEKILSVQTIWMTESATGITKLITMYPDKGKTP
ncbi:MAG: hypothetical protein EPN21_17840 [Methylococcaceae bacterium]|nr:MAG: hypothetical protein EPN21_17840 [Methylococcaceae bacterium]